MMKEIEDLTLDALAPGEEQVRNCFSVASESTRGTERCAVFQTWPEITEPMKNVIRNEQAAGLENVRRNVDLTKTTVFTCGKPSPLLDAVNAALKGKVAALKMAKTYVLFSRLSIRHMICTRSSVTPEKCSPSCSTRA